MYRRRGGAPKPYMKISRKKVLYQKYPKNTPFQHFWSFSRGKPQIRGKSVFVNISHFKNTRFVCLSAQSNSSKQYLSNYVSNSSGEVFFKTQARKNGKIGNLERCVFGLPLHPELSPSKSSCRVSTLHPFVYT